MHKQLPVAQTIVFVVALFFSATNLAFASYTTSFKQVTNDVKHSQKTSAKLTKPTPTIQINARQKVLPTETPTPKLVIISPTTPIPSPTTITTVSIQPTTPPTTKPVTQSNGGSFIMNEINNYRQSQGLGPVQTSAETCAFAATRAQEIASAFNHDGFNNKVSSKTLPYAKWSSVTENIAMTSNANNVVNMWINSPGHAANMRADTPYVCVQQHGNYYAYEGMKP